MSNPYKPPNSNINDDNRPKKSRIFIVGFLLIIYGLYLTYLTAINEIYEVHRILYVSSSVFIAITGVLFLAGIYWSRYLIYLITITIIGEWLYSIYWYYGSVLWRTKSNSYIFISLLPGVFFTIVFMWFSYISHLAYGQRKVENSQ